MTIKTATGKEYECDLAVTSPEPPRLYLHLLNTDIADAARTFTDPSELPIEGFPDYQRFNSLNLEPDGGINITLA